MEEAKTNTVLVNLFAGPGAGKTTCAMEIAAELKKAGLTVEYVSEYAKELIYAEELDKLRDQEAVTGEQIRRLNLPKGQVDVLVTDAPIMLGEIYGKNNSPEFSAELLKAHNSFENFNLFIKRGQGFQQEGRLQNETEAKAIDERIKNLLHDKGIYFGVYDHKMVDLVVKNIQTRLETLKKTQEKGEIKMDEKTKIQPLAIKCSTEKAVLVQLEIAGADKPKGTWFPKSQITLDEEGKNVIAVNNYLEKKYGNILSKQKEIAAEKAGKKVDIDVDALLRTAEESEIAKNARLSGIELVKKINAERLNAIEKNTPPEMKRLPNWCVLKLYKDKEADPPAYKKFIVNANNPAGGWASHKDPTNWTTFDKALEYARANGGAGLSFAIKGSGFNAFDLDHCYDKETRTFNDTAKKFLEQLSDSYAEKSISGTGLHIFTKSQVCEGGKYNEARGDSAPIEVFENWGFVSMTGNIVDQKHKNLTALPDSVKTEIQNQIGEKKQAAEPSKWHTTNIAHNESEQEIIDKIERSRKGDEFQQMMSGADICGDRSRTDAKMMNILAYFSHSNQNQMESIFRSSGLYRKEKGDNYIRRTAEFAIKNLAKDKDR